MQGSRGNLFTRDDTFFGICQGLGEDFGFNPLWLRITLGVLLLWNPVVVLGTYLGLGVIVAASRLLYPNSKRSAEAPAAEDGAHAVDDAVEPMAQAA